MNTATFVITGPPSSGKSTATKIIQEYCEKNNIEFISKKFSAPIALGIEKQGYKIISENGANFYTKGTEKISQRTLMQNYGNKLRESYGPQVLAQILLGDNEIQEVMKKGVVVFEGVRNLHELEYIQKSAKKVYLIGIFTDLQNSFNRASNNKPASFEDFKIQYELEMKDKVEDDDIQVKLLLEKSKSEGIFLENNTEIDEFKKNINESLDKIFV